MRFIFIVFIFSIYIIQADTFIKAIQAFKFRSYTTNLYTSDGRFSKLQGLIKDGNKSQGDDEALPELLDPELEASLKVLEEFNLNYLKRMSIERKVGKLPEAIESNYYANLPNKDLYYQTIKNAMLKISKSDSCELITMGIMAKNKEIGLKVDLLI